MIAKVGRESSKWAEAPTKFEAGTSADRRGDRRSAPRCDFLAGSAWTRREQRESRATCSSA